MSSRSDKPLKKQQDTAQINHSISRDVRDRFTTLTKNEGTGAVLEKLLLQFIAYRDTLESSEDFGEVIRTLERRLAEQTEATVAAQTEVTAIRRELELRTSRDMPHEVTRGRPVLRNFERADRLYVYANDIEGLVSNADNEEFLLERAGLPGKRTIVLTWHHFEIPSLATSVQTASYRLHRTARLLDGLRNSDIGHPFIFASFSTPSDHPPAEAAILLATESVAGYSSGPTNRDADRMHWWFDPVDTQGEWYITRRIEPSNLLVWFASHTEAWPVDIAKTLEGAPTVGTFQDGDAFEYIPRR